LPPTSVLKSRPGGVCASWPRLALRWPFDAKRSASLSYIAEVAVLLGDGEVAARLYELLSVYKHMTITAGVITVCYGAASRYLGMLAATLGEFDSAEVHFEHALEMNERIGARPWLAHTNAEYALVLRRTPLRYRRDFSFAFSRFAPKVAVERGRAASPKRTYD
jgi:hypothetical protein